MLILLMLKLFLGCLFFCEVEVGSACLLYVGFSPVYLFIDLYLYRSVKRETM